MRCPLDSSNVSFRCQIFLEIRPLFFSSAPTTDSCYVYMYVCACEDSVGQRQRVQCALALRSLQCLGCLPVAIFASCQ
jgi:hypothetical protein